MTHNENSIQDADHFGEVHPERPESLGDAGAFLAQASDSDLLRFLRRLPMVAGTEDGTVTLGDLIYEMKLWAYVKTAWAKVDGQPGIPGRLKQASEAYKRAEQQFEKETGERRRTPRVIDLPSFVKIYTGEGLP
jgi:hypothetical protein